MAGFGDYSRGKGGYGNGEILDVLGRRGGSTVGPKAAYGNATSRVVGMGSGDLKRVLGKSAGRKGHHATPSRGTGRKK